MSLMAQLCLHLPAQSAFRRENLRSPESSFGSLVWINFPQQDRGEGDWGVCFMRLSETPDGQQSSQPYPSCPNSSKTMGPQTSALVQCNPLFLVKGSRHSTKSRLFCALGSTRVVGIY